jgi:hypothetical protein
LAFAEILGGPSGEEQVRAADFDVIPSIAGARLSHLQTAMMRADANITHCMWRAS